MWAPNMNISEQQLDEYLEKAMKNFNYSLEQAYSLLFWHRQDLAKVDLTKFTPKITEWSTEDKAVFQQALKSQGKDFAKIKSLMPNKTLASLVEHYYTRSLPKKKENQEKKKEKREEKKIKKKESVRSKAKTEFSERIHGVFSQQPRNSGKLSKSQEERFHISQHPTSGPGQ